MLIKGILDLMSGEKVGTCLFEIFFGIFYGGLPWVSMILTILILNIANLITYIIGMISIIVLVVFIRIMPKRTPMGNELLGKINGFIKFLEVAEKPQLEQLVNENPEYFYNILPYTYALDVSDMWMSKFEIMALQAPNWYYGTEPFSTHNFGIFLTNTMRTAESTMSSTPSSDSSGSSGGGFSGGGFSGGGSGGGGGGSW